MTLSASVTVARPVSAEICEFGLEGSGVPGHSGIEDFGHMSVSMVGRVICGEEFPALHI